ncbi:MAG: NUDIX domain-containing protein [Candidatus Heimdallarchaeota archaeon]|nr:NUDIX domain-containing protein [Candidatus Heimdallarchaeota archaeon]
MTVMTPTMTVVHGVAYKDGKYLLIQERDGSWYFPAGRIHNNETIIDGLIREVREESGLDCIVTGLITIEHTFIHEDKDPSARLVVIFEIELIGGQLKIFPDTDTLQAKWFDISEIVELPLRSIALLEILENYQKLKGENRILPIEYFNTYVF